MIAKRSGDYDDPLSTDRKHSKGPMLIEIQQQLWVVVGGCPTMGHGRQRLFSGVRSILLFKTVLHPANTAKCEVIIHTRNLAIVGQQRPLLCITLGNELATAFETDF